MILCVAVVGQQNNPLYLQSFTQGEDELKFHYVVHSSLDVFDERVAVPRRASAALLDNNFLGLLFPTEDYKVYGYMTNTRIKFILVTAEQDSKEADLKNFFQRLHSAYIDVASNPFHVPGKRISSPAFSQQVSTIVEMFGSSHNN